MSTMPNGTKRTSKSLPPHSTTKTRARSPAAARAGVHAGPYQPNRVMKLPNISKRASMSSLTSNSVTHCPRATTARASAARSSCARNSSNGSRRYPRTSRAANPGSCLEINFIRKTPENPNDNSSRHHGVPLRFDTCQRLCLIRFSLHRWGR